MAESIQSGLVQATQVARETAVRCAANGLHFAAYGETGQDDADLVRMVQAVPISIAAALTRKAYYFVPLALAEGRGSESAGHRSGNEETMISPVLALSASWMMTVSPSRMPALIMESPVTSKA